MGVQKQKERIMHDLTITLPALPVWALVPTVVLGCAAFATVAVRWLR